MFIVFEGIDGCGKSTQAKMLSQALKEEGCDVFLTAEPTKGKLGLFIREILSGRENADPKTLALLFTADRYEHLKNEVAPALSSNRLVVCERYYHSTIAYQTVQGVDSEWLFEINRFALKPDLVIFLDVKPKTAVVRKEGREIFEEREFLEKVYREYLRFVDIEKVDGEGGPQDVYARVRRAVDKFI